VTQDNVKRVVVPINQFPSGEPGEEYFVRYRIVSEDQNRRSAWTPPVKIGLEIGRFVVDGGKEFPREEGGL
jgi:hypothetical protein